MKISNIFHFSNQRRGRAEDSLFRQLELVLVGATESCARRNNKECSPAYDWHVWEHRHVRAGHMVDRMQKGINGTKAVRIPLCISEISFIFRLTLCQTAWTPGHTRRARKRRCSPPSIWAGTVAQLLSFLGLPVTIGQWNTRQKTECGKRFVSYN